ncbi:MAG: DUF4982 domain-containing protein [Chitinispirillaceae bacterium]|nr:DUF4982 domain-containing protein [Chitinispirillaceae bacterium]
MGEYTGVTCLAGMTALLCLFSAAFAREVPPSGNRVTQNFNLGWKYYQGDVNGAEAVSFGDGGWENAVLPHNTKWITPDNDEAYQGVAWYRKHFTLSEDYQGRKIFIEFEGAMQQSRVWVNGESMGTYEGGYMGFVYDITDQVSLSGENVIAVRIDTRSNSNWAPGRVDVDFRYYGGLYRDAWLHITDKLHVTHELFADTKAGGGVFVTYPAVSTSEATVNVKTQVINENGSAANCTVVSDIIDATGTVAGTATATSSIDASASKTFSQAITISNPKLWNHLTPNCYTLHTTVKNGTATVDYLMTRIGIRRIDWTRSQGVKINNDFYKLRGTNEHQDIYGLGNALSDRAIFYEIKMIKEAGFDFIRCAHYPHDPSLYDACDSLGILVMNCLTGWQSFPNNSSFKNNTYKECREMVRRDRNHPSVVIWETSLNESRYDDAWARTVHDIAHEEYPGDQMFTNGYRTSVFDVFSDAAAHDALYNERSRPVIVAEYGDWEYGGFTSSSRVLREDSDDKLLTQAYNHQHRMNMNRSYSWFSVDAFWCYGDYGSVLLDGPFFGGCTDMYRLPKYSYYFFRSQRSPKDSIPGVSMGPMVFIANRWQQGSPTTVKVYSNCDSVSLYKNGSLVATRGHDADDISNRLDYPPFTFNGVSFTTGTLRADGKIRGTVAATHSRTTPEAAAAVQLRPISSEPLFADGSEARLVWIDVIDAKGTVVPTSTARVNISVTGDATILGPSTVTMKGGRLATWVRAGTSDGSITVNATSNGLTEGSLELSIGSPPVTMKRAITSSYRKVASPAVMTRRVIGSAIRLPAEYADGLKTVTVYNLAGRRIYRTTTRKQVVRFNGNLQLPHKVYVISLSAQKQL